MRPLQHKCPTLRGDKDDKERRQTITCQRLHPKYGIPLPPDVRVYHPGAPIQGPPPTHPTSPGHHHPGDRRLCSATTTTHANHRQHRPREPHLRLSPHSNCPPTHTQRHRDHLLH